MDKETIQLAIQGLEIQRSKIEAAIKDLESQFNRRSRVRAVKPARQKRTLSAAARRAISEAQKKRWAKQRKKLNE